MHHYVRFRRFLCPPWQKVQLESKELMAACLRKIPGLSKVKLIGIDQCLLWQLVKLRSSSKFLTIVFLLFNTEAASDKVSLVSIIFLMKFFCHTVSYWSCSFFGILYQITMRCSTIVERHNCLRSDLLNISAINVESILLYEPSKIICCCQYSWLWAFLSNFEVMTTVHQPLFQQSLSSSLSVIAHSSL